jgi:hypothetical protein
MDWALLSDGFRWILLDSIGVHWTPVETPRRFVVTDRGATLPAKTPTTPRPYA